MTAFRIDEHGYDYVTDHESTSVFRIHEGQAHRDGIEPSVHFARFGLHDQATIEELTKGWLQGYRHGRRKGRQEKARQILDALHGP